MTDDRDAFAQTPGPDAESLVLDFAARSANWIVPRLLLPRLLRNVDRRGRRAAEMVFQHASKEQLAEFLGRKASVASADEQEIVLQLVWSLPDLPEQLEQVVPSWAESGDPNDAALAGRLLDRD